MNQFSTGYYNLKDRLRQHGIQQYWLEFLPDCYLCNAALAAALMRRQENLVF